MGRVDCTKDGNRPLCQRNHIMAFPTIRVYRLGQTHSHEFYDGERQTSAFMEYINNEVANLKTTIVRDETNDGSVGDDPVPAIHTQGMVQPREHSTVLHDAGICVVLISLSLMTMAMADPFDC
jgi:hypothetical protein